MVIVTTLTEPVVDDAARVHHVSAADPVVLPEHVELYVVAVLWRHTAVLLSLIHI